MRSMANQQNSHEINRSEAKPSSPDGEGNHYIANATPQMGRRDLNVILIQVLIQSTGIFAFSRIIPLPRFFPGRASQRSPIQPDEQADRAMRYTCGPVFPQKTALLGLTPWGAHAYFTLTLIKSGGG